MAQKTNDQQSMKEIVLLGKIAGVVYGITIILWLAVNGYLNFIGYGFLYVLHRFTIIAEWVSINVSMWISFPTFIIAFLWIAIVNRK